jgi:hypothetical protein
MLIMQVEGTGSKEPPSFLGRGFARMARWRNPTGRIRDHHESSSCGVSRKQDKREMTPAEDERDA